MADTRYTLSLPEGIYEELKQLAEKHDVSVRDVVRQFLKFGLLAISIIEEKNGDVIIREKLDANSNEVRETKIMFMW